MQAHMPHTHTLLYEPFLYTLAGPVKEPLDEDPGYTSRDQQLSFKAKKKTTRGKGKAKSNRKKNKGRKGKSEKKTKGKAEDKKVSTDKVGNRKKPKRSTAAARVSRKRQILSAGSHTPVEASPPKQPRKARKASKPGADLPSHNPAPKRKADQQTAAKPKAKAAPKAQPRAKAKAKARAGRKSLQDTILASPLRSDEMVKGLVTWVKQFGSEFEDPALKGKYKAEVRSSLVPLRATRLNIYWSRNTCGVQVLSDEDAPKHTKGKKGKHGKSKESAKKAKDLHHFCFNGINASWLYKSSMSIRCAELAVSWFKYGKQEETNIS